MPSAVIVKEMLLASRLRPLRWALPPLLLLGLSGLALAQEARVNRSHPFRPDQCGPVDPSYIRVAEQTGGQPFFFQRSEVAQAMNLMRETMGQNIVKALWAKGTLQGDSREFAVLVDPTMQRLTFSLSVDTKGTALEVLRPSGAAAAPGDPGTEITGLNCGRIVTLALPETGAWRARVTGSGRFWLQAQAKSEIFFVAVEFVELGGRIGHQGFFRISGQPLAGKPATLEASLSGPIGAVDFALIGENAERLKSIPMKRESPDSDDREYAGTFELPRVPFRVEASGLDPHGNSYRRVFETLFHAETVEVTPKVHLEDLPPGKTTPVEFTVRNLGPARTFGITVADAHQFVTRVEPKEVELAEGASATVTVDVTVPETTPAGTGDDLSIVATSTTEPATTNSAVVSLSVFRETHP